MDPAVHRVHPSDDSVAPCTDSIQGEGVLVAMPDDDSMDFMFI